MDTASNMPLSTQQSTTFFVARNNSSVKKQHLKKNPYLQTQNVNVEPYKGSDSTTDLRSKRPSSAGLTPLILKKPTESQLALQQEKKKQLAKNYHIFSPYRKHLHNSVSGRQNLIDRLSVDVKGAKSMEKRIEDIQVKEIPQTATTKQVKAV